MDEKKYKPDVKGKLTKVAGDLEKVLGVRGPEKKPEAKPSG